MTLVYALAQTSTLPPPPSPDASVGVGTWQWMLTLVFLIGALMLALYAIRAGSWRPMLAGGADVSQVPESEPEVRVAPVTRSVTVDESLPVSSSKPIAFQSAISEPVVHAVDPAIAERLRQLIEGDSAHRRRLGDRKGPAVGTTEHADDATIRPATNVIPFERPGEPAKFESSPIAEESDLNPEVEAVAPPVRATLAEQFSRTGQGGDTVSDSSWTQVGDLRVLNGGAASAPSKPPVETPGVTGYQYDPLPDLDFSGADDTPPLDPETLAAIFSVIASAESEWALDPAKRRSEYAEPSDAPVPEPVEIGEDFVFGASTSTMFASELEPQPSGENVDVNPEAELLAGLTETVKELVFCANVGEMLHGFALYTDPFLFRTMDESGMSEAEFREAFEAGEPQPAENWLMLDSISDIHHLEGGEVVATISLGDPRAGTAMDPERFRFVYHESRQVWLIDDIAPLP